MPRRLSNAVVRLGENGGRASRLKPPGLAKASVMRSHARVFEDRKDALNSAAAAMATSSESPRRACTNDAIRSFLRWSRGLFGLVVTVHEVAEDGFGRVVDT